MTTGAGAHRDGPWPPGTDPAAVIADLTATQSPSHAAAHTVLARLLVGRPGWSLGADPDGGREWLLDADDVPDADWCLALTVYRSDLPDPTIHLYLPDHLLPELADVSDVLPLSLVEPWLDRYEHAYRRGEGWARSRSARSALAAVTTFVEGEPLAWQVRLEPTGRPDMVGSGVVVATGDGESLVATFGVSALRGAQVTWRGVTDPDQAEPDLWALIDSVGEVPDLDGVCRLTVPWSSQRGAGAVVAVRFVPDPDLDLDGVEPGRRWRRVQPTLRMLGTD